MCLTSLRLRNPANAPDAAERAALDHVANLIAAGEETPAFLVQKVAAMNPGLIAPLFGGGVAEVMAGPVAREQASFIASLRIK